MAEANAIHHYVLHLIEYNVLLCRSCKHCISPVGDGIKRHFMKHRKTVALDTRRAIIDHVKSLQLMEPENITLPIEEIEPIMGLELLVGLRCQEKYNEEECHYCCITEGSMKIHCKEEHGWVKSKGVSWKKQSVQTFFEGRLIKYFPVISNDTDNDSTQPLTSVDNLIERLLEEADERDKEQQRTLNKISDTQNLVTLTPWLRRTGWPRMFA